MANLHAGLIATPMSAHAANPLMRRQQLLGAGVLCLALAGCANTPPPKPFPAFTGALGPTYATEPAQGLSPASQRLLRELGGYYQEWAGVPYRYGGTSKNGIDCSAFVKQTVSTVRGVRLPRTTLGQSHRGQPVAPGNLRIGDLVFFKTGGGRHVGIYIGNNQFMHASSSVGVTISSLKNVYWRRHYWQARRLP